MTHKVVIEVSPNRPNSCCRGIVCCKDEEFDQANRIRIKAMKIVVSIPGFKSMALEGEERNIITVIGDQEINAVRLVKLLQKKVCFAKIVSLDTKQTNPEPTPLQPFWAVADRIVQKIFR